MKRHKWVDVWDGTSYRPLQQDAAPAPSSKFAGPDKIWNREMGVGKSTTTENEPRTPPPTQGSITCEANNPSETQKTSLPSNSRDGKPKETKDMGPPHFARTPVHESLGTEIHSDRDESNTNLPSQINPISAEARSLPRGLQSSRWAQGDTNVPHNGYNSPTKTVDHRRSLVVSSTPFNKRDNATRPYMPSPKASVSGTAQEATYVTPRHDTPKPRILAARSTEQQTNDKKATEAAAATEANKESNDEKFNHPIQKLKYEKLQGIGREYSFKRDGGETHGKKPEKDTWPKQETEDKAKISSQAQHRDTWEGWRSDSESHPNLNQAPDENNQPTSTKAPNNEAIPVPLTQDALCAKFGSCPKDRSESDDPLSCVSATGVENVEPNPLVSRDPRGEWPEEPKPEQDWNQTRRPKPKKYWESDSIHSGDVLILSGPMKKFVLWWILAIPDVKSDFLNWRTPDHDRCDIDTFTGNLNEPIDYPDTMRASGSDWAQINRTTEDVVNQAMSQQRSKLVRASRNKSRREMAAREAAIQREIEEAINPDEVKTDCHIRPATADDMEAVAAIYNREVEKSYTVVDLQPISVKKFCNLLNICKTLHQPFVVAVKGWHHSDFDNSSQSIIGFCLVDSLTKGIMGSRDTSTKDCGKITLVVRPDFRQKKIGTALLDVIMNCCSTKHSSRQGYQWVCDRGDTTHMSPPHNSHNWHILQMEVLVKSGKSVADVKQREKWIVDFLESKFLFVLGKHDDHFCCHPNPEMGVGTERWLDRLTFEHRSRDYNM